LQVKEVASLNVTGDSFKLLEIMSLPAAYTKGADAMGRSASTYQRKSISFDVDRFSQVVRQIEKLAKSGAEILPEDFYPPVKLHKGRSRDLPMVDKPLRQALSAYLEHRINSGDRP